MSNNNNQKTKPVHYCRKHRSNTCGCEWNVTTFDTIALTGTTDQITMGTGTTTTIDADPPTSNQYVSIPDSGAATTSFILADAKTTQTINSGVLCKSGVQIDNGVLQVTTPTSGVANLNISGDSSTSTTAAAVVVQTNSYLATPKTSASYLNDDQDGDTVLMNAANSSTYPNATIKMGFKGGNSLVSLARSVLNSNVPVAVTQTSNQVVLGTTKTTTLSAVTPGSNQTLTIPDSGASSSSFILGNSASQQTIASSLAVASNVTISPTSTTFMNGSVQIQPDSSNNNKAAIKLFGYGPSANALEFNAGWGSMAGLKSTGQYLSDDATGDMVLINNAPGTLYSTASIRFGFVPNSGTTLAPSLLTLNRSTFTAAIPVVVSGTNTLTVGGQIIGSQTTNQAKFGNATINCTAGGPRVMTLPDSYQNANIITNSIITGLTNSSSRPAVTGSTTPQNYEIRAFSTQSLSNDDGFLRIRGGGGTNANTASYIDVSGASTVTDMNSNIVLGVQGAEAVRIDSNGLTLASGSIKTPAITLTPVTGSLSLTGSLTGTINYRYQITGNQVTLVIGALSATTTSMGSTTINLQLPTAITPNSSAIIGSSLVQLPFILNTGSACVSIDTSRNLKIYPNTSTTSTFGTSVSVSWNTQVLTYLIS